MAGTQARLAKSDEGGPNKKVRGWQLSVKFTTHSDIELAVNGDENNNYVCGFCNIGFYSDVSRKKND